MKASLLSSSSSSPSSSSSIAFFSSEHGTNSLTKRSSTTATTTTTVALLDAVLTLRGGASKRSGRTASLHSSSSSNKKKSATGRRSVSKSKSEQPSAFSESLSKYKSIMPLTRIYISLVGVVTLASLILGEELTQTLLALDPIRFLYGLELWRPITAAVFLGPPSIGSLMSGYYLFEYGSNLERAYGSAQHLIFLLTQITLLTTLSIFLGQPFYGSSMVTSMLHVLSRSMPKQQVKWLIFTVPYWVLPYGLMLADVLQGQNNPALALPHILGILTGHFYYFHKFVWPKAGRGGEDWLVPPDFVRNVLDPDVAKKEKGTASLKLSRKRKKGRKLGGGSGK